eukprot:6046155-Prymnesium_polylepis.1
MGLYPFLHLAAAAANNASTMLTANSGYLSVSKPLWQLDAKGMMLLPASVDRFSMDVGVNKGKCTRQWLEESASTFVIGVEANSRLVAMLTEVENPHKNQPQTYVTWNNRTHTGKIDVGLVAMALSAKTIAANTHRCMVINAAAGRGGGARRDQTTVKLTMARTLTRTRHTRHGIEHHTHARSPPSSDAIPPAHVGWQELQHRGDK